MRIITAFLFLFLMSSTFVYAQGLKIRIVPFEAEGTVKSQSQVMAAPPHGLLNLFVGKEIKTIEPGDKVKIIGKKTYPGFSGDHIWYQIMPTDKSKWWVYGGVEGKEAKVQIDKTIKFRRGAEHGI